MTDRFAASNVFDARYGASCGASFTTGTSALFLVLGIALAVSILICGIIIGIVRLLSLVILISLLVGNTPRRLRTAA